MYGEHPKQFNKTYRIQIAHTEQEIDTDWFYQTGSHIYVMPSNKLASTCS